MNDRDVTFDARYRFAVVGPDVLPACVLRYGLVWSRVLVFRPFHGTSVRRVRNRRLVDVDTANALLRFKKDPLALLHMTGEEPPA